MGTPHLIVSASRTAAQSQALQARQRSTRSGHRVAITCGNRFVAKLGNPARSFQPQREGHPSGKAPLTRRDAGLHVHAAPGTTAAVRAVRGSTGIRGTVDVCPQHDPGPDEKRDGVELLPASGRVAHPLFRSHREQKAGERSPDACRHDRDAGSCFPGVEVPGTRNQCAKRCSRRGVAVFRMLPIRMLPIRMLPIRMLILGLGRRRKQKQEKYDVQRIASSTRLAMHVLRSRQDLAGYFYVIDS